MPRDVRNLNEALEEIENISIRTTQGSFVRVEDVKRLLQEKLEVRKNELEEHPIPYRMKPEQARRLAMKDESLRETHHSEPREPGKAVPAGPIASEGVKS